MECQSTHLRLTDPGRCSASSVLNSSGGKDECIEHHAACEHGRGSLHLPGNGKRCLLRGLPKGNTHVTHFCAGCRTQATLALHACACPRTAQSGEGCHLAPVSIRPDPENEPSRCGCATLAGENRSGREYLWHRSSQRWKRRGSVGGRSEPSGARDSRSPQQKASCASQSQATQNPLPPQTVRQSSSPCGLAGPFPAFACPEPTHVGSEAAKLVSGWNALDGTHHI